MTNFAKPPCRRARWLLAAGLCTVVPPVHAQFENDASRTEPGNPFDLAIAHPLWDVFAPRLHPGARRATDRAPDAGSAQPAGVLQTGDFAAWPALFAAPGLTVKGSVTGTLGLFAMRDNQFVLPPPQVTPAYREDPGWGEFFLEPGVTVQYRLAPALQLYGGAAYMETGTRGTDYDGVANTYHGDMEQLYAGARWSDAASGVKLDASYGQQDYSVGRSLLVASGASNGPQRGANYIGPRAAWANAVLLRASWRDVTAEGFWLKPNETTSGYTGTRLTGINVQWTGPGPLRLGAMYAYVPDAAIATREGLNVYNVRARLHPIASAPQAWVQGEVAWERKDGVSADGWYAALNYNAQDAQWKPLVTVRYASFSGDKPGTPTWEGFDPLFYGGSDPDWYQGKLGSTLFSNTNLDSVAVSLTLAPNERNLLQLIYLGFAAAQVDAPLAIPAPGKPIPVGGGVPARALASEVDAVWTYTFGKQVNVNAFAAWAAPGAGYRQLYESQGGRAQNWWILGTQLNISY
ncbi:MAG: alginate export family protein [Burkholderiales bacterium]